MKDEVFRFVYVRPVQAVSEDKLQLRFASYGSAKESPLQKKVGALRGNQVREQAHQIAVSTLAGTDRGPEVSRLVAAVKDAAAAPDASTAKKRLAATLGTSPEAYLKSGPAQSLKDGLWDQLYAHVLAPDVKPASRAAVYDGVRAFHFVEHLAQQPDQSPPLTWEAIQAVIPTVPPNLVPAMSAAPVQPEANKQLTRRAQKGA